MKVYGRDARDAALMATLWRRVWFREPGSPARLGRLDQVEHEALLTLLAAQAGVRPRRWSLRERPSTATRCWS